MLVNNSKGGLSMDFDEAATNWDTDKKIKRAKVIADKIISSIKIDHNKKYTAMEFGCGTGLVSFNLYNYFEKVTLVDASEGMLDVLNSKIAKSNVDNMVTLLANEDFEDAIDEKFDVIYNSMVLHHIQDIPEILNKFYNWLKVDGWLCIVDLNKEDGRFHEHELDFDGHNGFEQEELKKRLKTIGFDEIESETFFYDKRISGDTEMDYSLFLMLARRKSSV